MSKKVLLIDDNAMYRAAFKRNLVLRDYEVVEAENGDDAVTSFQSARPDFVITDLAMRTPREGLEVIRSIKQLDPLAPVVLISAVGTFEEGAEAQSLGAFKVVSKANIDDQIDVLFTALDRAGVEASRNRSARLEVERVLADPEASDETLVQRLRQLVADPGLHPVVRSEAYDALLAATEAEIRKGTGGTGDDAREREADEHLRRLAEEIPGLDKLSAESLKELRNAELFFHQQGDSRPTAGSDFSRNIGFSYCFAVENEVKLRLRRRLQRFLSIRKNLDHVRAMLDPKTLQLDLLVHQYVIRLLQQIPFDFTVENVRQVFQRILEHEARYKPDGLKALGIMMVFFGRDFSLRTVREILHIENPLGMKAFESEMHLMRFACLLVALQHYRNPYIHPEISEMEKVSKIRQTAVQCLREVTKITP